MLGFTPLQLVQKTHFENALDLSSLWTPLISSYNEASQEKSGAPKKDDEALTDEGASSRDDGKNEGTAAKKALNSSPARGRGRPRKTKE